MAGPSSVMPLRLSPEADAAIAQVCAAARDLQAALRGADDAPGEWADIAQSLARYLAILEQGLAEAASAKAQQGLGLLTTMNRGVAEAERSAGNAGKGEKAFALSRAAIAAARLLREEWSASP